MGQVDAHHIRISHISRRHGFYQVSHLGQAQSDGRSKMLGHMISHPGHVDPSDIADRLRTLFPHAHRLECENENTQDQHEDQADDQISCIF